MVTQPRTLAEALKMLHEQNLPRGVLDEIPKLEARVANMRGHEAAMTRIEELIGHRPRTRPKMSRGQKVMVFLAALVAAAVFWLVFTFAIAMPLTWVMMKFQPKASDSSQPDPYDDRLW